MRILHVSEVHWGGVVNLIQEFAREQVAAGDNVAVLAPRGFPDLAAGRRVDWSIDRSRVSTLPGALRELRNTVRAFKPDVVHLHSFVAGFVGRLPGAVAGVPVVYQPHAWSFDLLESRIFGTALRSWERLAGRRTSMLVTNCDDEIAEGRRVGVKTAARNIGIIIDTDRYVPLPADGNRDQVRPQCAGARTRMLVCIGRLTRQKGQDLLVAAWERDRPDDTELVLVGPGGTAGLAALAPTQWGRTIRAVGEQSDVIPWLWASDALVLSSRYETVALVLGEAMAAARPVVATAVNGAREVVLDGELPAAGSVVPLGDMRSLIRAASDVLDDTDLAESFATAGRRRAEDFFTASNVGQRLRAAYREATREDEGFSRGKRQSAL